ncbi:MaoC family dehydratase N-terminal domain-containing protein [Chloroflexota bacterium]
MEPNEIGLESKITPEMIQGLMEDKGKEIPNKWGWNEEATRDTIRHFVDAIGDTNPLWRDEEYAAKTTLKALLAPPTFLLSVAMAPRMGMPGIHSLHAGTHFYFYEPIKLFDRFRVTGGIHDLEIKEKSNWTGKSVVETLFTNYWHYDGRLMAKALHTIIRGERKAAASNKKYADIKIEPISEETLQKVWQAMDMEDTNRLGAQLRYWEEVNIGEELTPVVRGPLSISDMVAWKMGWGNHAPHHMWCDKMRYLANKRHPGAPVRNELNVPDAPERVHVDRNLPLTLGFPSFYDYGPNRIAWLGQVLTNWMGDDGFIEELQCQTRVPNFEGDIQWCRGVVTGKHIKDNKHVVEINLSAESQRGVTTMPGTAVIRLPSKG